MIKGTRTTAAQEPKKKRKYRVHDPILLGGKAGASATAPGYFIDTAAIAIRQCASFYYSPS